MTIEDMHFDFKMKLNKIDTQQYKNLRIPEIDWVLNQALELFVKMVAKPRLRNHLGFETSQRSIDDIRTIVKETNVAVVANMVALPIDYWHFAKGVVHATKGSCVDVKCRLKIRQHDDDFESNSFYSSSFEWRTVNGIFTENGIEIFDDGSFTNNTVDISYIRKPLYIHNAKDFTGGTYNLPDGNSLILSQDCELPFQTHSEIVDLAVALITGQLNNIDPQIKLSKLNLE